MTTTRTTLVLTRDYAGDLSLPSTLGRREAFRRLSDFLAALNNGAKSGTTLVVQDTSVYATATVTCANVNAADTVTVGNTVFTAVNGGTPTSVQFDMSGDATAEGAALAAAINAHTTVSKIVSASAATGVVTLTAKVPGAIGNGLQLSSSNGTRLAVVAFASGANDSAVTFTL